MSAAVPNRAAAVVTELKIGAAAEKFSYFQFQRERPIRRRFERSSPRFHQDKPFVKSAVFFIA